ncbi:MAG: hypothetical protein LH610_11595 [Sphingomonas bacterium]|nr:hypothetical protein [Sphingomonas bacterium]
MVQAKGQAERYAKALPVDHGWPPILLVADIGYCIEVYADFSGSGKAYAQFPDRSRYRIMLDDLRDEQVRDRLRAVWAAPATLDPAAETARVTREIADLLATVARRIEKRGHNAEATSGFLMRILFTMFAEDSNLIPEGSFTNLLKNQRKVIEYGPLFQTPHDMKILTGTKQMLRGRYDQLQKFLPLDDSVAVLKVVHELPDLTSALTAIDQAVAAIPEPSSQDAARAFLTVGQERLEQYRTARKRHASGKARSERAALVFKIFGDTTTKALEAIYHEVQEAFADYYRQINKDDESDFTAHLLPSIGKLGFDVDFYGRGRFPPGAYHSEGHQDGMGLCLYLALMGHLLGKGFTFAVLDDVLMSVDKGHRREVCALLKSRFPDTQFIFTTHDEVWLRHMKSEGIIKSKNAAQFRTWMVETGPAEWTTNSVWDEIDEHLAKNDVSAAAAALRRYLEYFAGEASHRLRAAVEFRGDGEFMLSDTLPAAIGALGTAFKSAKGAANSWGQSDLVAAIGVLEAPFTASKLTTNVEQWQINKAVHYNAWADLEKGDFLPVVAAFRALTAHFSCPTCEEMLSITPERGSKMALRCTCGSVNLNFNTKPAGAKTVSEPKAGPAPVL